MSASWRRGVWVGSLLAAMLVQSAPSGRRPDARPPDGVGSELDSTAHPAATEAAVPALCSTLPGVRLQTCILPHGVDVVRSTGGPDDTPIASVRLVGFGRADSLIAIDSGELVSGPDRIEIRRPGILEWLAERSEGLEQGFTIDARPPGAGPLRLELDVSPARAIASVGSIRIETAEGQSLSYGELSVADAAGNAIPARFEVSGPSRISLVVDEREASYPIVIDPLLSATIDTTLVSDQDSSLFGYTVASAGDVNGDGFDDVIVGAYQYDIVDNGEENGAAFIFHGGPDGISNLSATAAATRLGGGVRYQYFGVSVAGAGDVNGDGFDDVIVGSNYTNGELDEGAAFIYHGRPGGIPNGASADTTLQGNQINAGFGYSVASAGDVNGDGKDDVIVGAPIYDTDIFGDLIPDAGAAFVFLGSPAGVTNGGADTAATRLTSSQPDSAFGFSVASAGDVDGDSKDDVIVGARHFSSGQLDEGAAFIFRGSPTGIADATTSTAATVLQTDEVGARLFDVASAGDLDDDGFGDVVVGIPEYSVTDDGAAFVFMGSPTGIPSGGAANAIVLSSDRASASFGTRAASAGDVNGDGYGDLVVGASRDTSGETAEGTVLVYLGGPDGVASQGSSLAFRLLQADDAGGLLGTSVASAGDVDGDGFSDLIAGAPYFGSNDSGAAFLWTGDDTGVDSDGDGLSDAQERLVHGTNPHDADSDDDLLNDFEEIEGGSNPRSASDPPLRATPLAIANRMLTAVAPVVRFKIDLATLPARPLMTVAAHADGTHEDMTLEVEVGHCNLEVHPTTSPPRDAEFCPRATNPIVSTGIGLLTASFRPWLCQVDPRQPPYVGKSCFVTVRALDFGTSGSPATFDLAVTGITDVPTATITASVVSQTPIESQADNGTQQPYFSEAQSFRWIYDYAPRDDIAETPIGGSCTYRRSEVPTANILPYTYAFNGSSGFSGPDCCTWQITSTTGVTGTGQAIFFVNTTADASTLADSDQDGIKDLCDNCDSVPNGPLRGTCLYGPRKDQTCRSNQDCLGSFCSLAQQDVNQDGLGDACPLPEPSTTGSLLVGALLLSRLAQRPRIASSSGDHRSTGRGAGVGLSGL